MKKHFTCTFAEVQYSFDPNAPLNISIPLQTGKSNPNCYYSPPPKFSPIKEGSFVGSVALGGACNHWQIQITPHGNGTHTECYGHISADLNATMANCLKKGLFFAQLISINPQQVGEDQVILRQDLESLISPKPIEALILRTLPNEETKLIQDYSGHNPPYLEKGCGDLLRERGVEHLLLDLPSVDRESDEGKLQVHHEFWGFPKEIRRFCTITELIYVNNNISDGFYLLNLQALNIQLDASPSKPVLYHLQANNEEKK